MCYLHRGGWHYLLMSSNSCTLNRQLHLSHSAWGWSKIAFHLQCMILWTPLDIFSIHKSTILLLVVLSDQNLFWGTPVVPSNMVCTWAIQQTSSPSDDTA
jgi:hypothetical protein